MANIKNQVKRWLEKLYYRNFDLISVIQQWDQIRNINVIFDVENTELQNDLKLPEIKQKSPYDN